MLESLLNKVAHVVSYNLCGVFKNKYFLITPQSQTTLQHKQIARVFIGIFRVHFSELSYLFFFLKVQRPYFGRIVRFL